MKNLKRLALAATLMTTLNVSAKNPIVDNVFTADPAAMVHDGKVYLYTGHDESPSNNVFFQMHDWLLFSSEDMVNWTQHGSIMRADDFKWAKGEAWAAHTIERDGKFYFYTTVRHKDDKPGFAVGVAVADTPYGPFKDARGSALITDDMTKHTSNDWDDIDPAIHVEENGDVYMFFGNLVPKYVKLKDNLIELDGPIKVVDVPNFTEAAWVHKNKDNYYLSYACEFPEKICYAMSKSIHGPWQYKGILNELAGNSETNHQAIISFKGQDYFFYHTGSLPPKPGQESGGRFRRSVAVEALHYNKDGTLKRVQMTTEGITKPVK
ncbi:glycoside hydrolase family 43 protein [Algibacillus agarilyticus]|uniref:glycoside hydrolase family 43 protein n=1 Tax=Algibacillus agarilyticus TaxID=2234133 RepID=UPI000DCF9611|nr:glycoside hydrolase family 43 protein [Algibacillus agarilyticus]